MGLGSKLKTIGKIALGVGLTAGARVDPTGTVANLVQNLRTAGVIKDAAAEAKATEILLAHEHRMLALEVKQLEVINKTYQAEAQFGDKVQRWARPACIWTIVLYVVNNFVLMPWFAPHGLQPIMLPPEVVMVLGAIAGITTWQRGREKEKRIATQAQTNQQG